MYLMCNFVMTICRGRNVFVYCARDNPILFETEEKLYPTVYLLWELHRAVPRLKTHPHVIKILMGGAGELKQF